MTSLTPLASDGGVASFSFALVGLLLMTSLTPPASDGGVASFDSRLDFFFEVEVEARDLDCFLGYIIIMCV